MKTQSKTGAKLPKISEHTDWHEDNLHAIQSLQLTIKTPFTVKSKKELTACPRYPKEIKLPPIMYPTPHDKIYHKIHDHLLESKVYEINLPESKSFDKTSSIYKSYRSSSSISFGQGPEMVKSVKNQEDPSKILAFSLKTSSNIEKWKETSKNMVQHQRLKYKGTSNNCISARELHINENTLNLQDFISLNPPKSPVNLQDSHKINNDRQSGKASFHNKSNQILKSFYDIKEENNIDIENYDKKIHKGDYCYNTNDNILEDSRESGTKYADSTRQYSSKAQSKFDDYKVVDDLEEGKKEGKKNYEGIESCKEILSYDMNGKILERENVVGKEKGNEDGSGGKGFKFNKKAQKVDNNLRENSEKKSKDNKKEKQILSKVGGGENIMIKDDKNKGSKTVRQMQEKEEKSKKIVRKSTFEANQTEKSKNDLIKAKVIEKKDKKDLGENEELNKNEPKRKQENANSKNKLEEIKDDIKSIAKSKDIEKKNESNPKYTEKKNALQNDKKDNPKKQQKSIEESKSTQKNFKEDLKSTNKISLANDPNLINKEKKQKSEKNVKLNIKENSEKSDNETLETLDTPQKKFANKSIKTEKLKQKTITLSENIIKNAKITIKNPSNTNKPIKEPKVIQNIPNQEIKKSTSQPSNIKIKEESESPPQEEINIDMSFESSHQITEDESIEEIIEEISDNESFEDFSESDNDSISSNENQSQKRTILTRKPKSKKNPKVYVKGSPNTKLSHLKNSGEFTLSSKEKLLSKQKVSTKNQVRDTKILKKKNKSPAKKSKKNKSKKEQIYSIDGEDLVIRVVNDDIKHQLSTQKDIGNKGYTDLGAIPLILESQESNYLSPSTDYHHKNTLHSTQDSLAKSLTIPHSTKGRKNSFTRLLAFPSTPTIKNPIESFISNFSISLLETINDLANYKNLSNEHTNQIRSPSIQNHDLPSISAHDNKPLEKALTCLNKQKDYQVESQDLVNDLPQDLNSKLYSSISLISSGSETRPIINQKPTLEPFPITLSEKFKNVSKFYSKKTEYEKIPSLLSKFSIIEKISQKNTLKKESDSSGSDNFSSSLESESGSEEVKNNDFLKHSALYEVENFELIKSLAKSIYGDKPIEESVSPSKEMDSFAEVLEENKKEGDKGVGETKDIDINELNIAFEQNDQRFLFFKQSSIKFEIPKLDLNIEKLTIESELDLENKRRIELKKLFLTSRSRNQSLEICKDLTSLKIFSIEANLADQLNLDMKAIQKALKHKKSFSQSQLFPSKRYKLSLKHN